MENAIVVWLQTMHTLFELWRNYTHCRIIAPLTTMQTKMNRKRSGYNVFSFLALHITLFKWLWLNENSVIWKSVEASKPNENKIRAAPSSQWIISTLIIAFMTDAFSGIFFLKANNKKIGEYLILCRFSGEIESFPMGVFYNTFQIPKCNSIRIEFMQRSQARVAEVIYIF